MYWCDFCTSNFFMTSWTQKKVVLHTICIFLHVHMVAITTKKWIRLIKFGTECTCDAYLCNDKLKFNINFKHNDMGSKIYDHILTLIITIASLFSKQTTHVELGFSSCIFNLVGLDVVIFFLGLWHGLIGTMWFPYKICRTFFWNNLLASSNIIVEDVPCKVVEKIVLILLKWLGGGCHDNGWLVSVFDICTCRCTIFR